LGRELLGDAFLIANVVNIFCGIAIVAGNEWVCASLVRFLFTIFPRTRPGHVRVCTSLY